MNLNSPEPCLPPLPATEDSSQPQGSKKRKKLADLLNNKSIDWCQISDLDFSHNRCYTCPISVVSHSLSCNQAMTDVYKQIHRSSMQTLLYIFNSFNKQRILNFLSLVSIFRFFNFEGLLSNNCRFVHNNFAKKKKGQPFLTALI